MVLQNCPQQRYDTADNNVRHTTNAQTAGPKMNNTFWLFHVSLPRVREMLLVKVDWSPTAHYWFCQCSSLRKVSQVSSHCPCDFGELVVRMFLIWCKTIRMNEVMVYFCVWSMLSELILPVNTRLMTNRNKILTSFVNTNGLKLERESRHEMKEKLSQYNFTWRNNIQFRNSFYI